MNRKTLTRIVVSLIIIISLASGIAYFILEEEKPWTAFYVACCGGVIVVNFVISLILINKNFKK